MKIKLETKKFKFEQALAVLSQDSSLSGKFTFFLEPKPSLNQDDVLSVKIKLPKELKALFKKENKDIFNQMTINIFVKQFYISTKNQNKSSNKKHIVYMNDRGEEELGFKIKKGKIRIDEDNKDYFGLKEGEELIKEVNFKNLKKFLKIFVYHRYFVGEFQY